MREIEAKGRLEQRLLTTSILATLSIGALALVFAVLTGSFAIAFDGVYALVDASMGGLALIVARLILADALKRDVEAPGRVRYQYGFWHLEPMVLALNATMLVLITGYAFVSAVLLLVEGGHTTDFDLAMIYSSLVVVACFGMAWRQRRLNRRLDSSFLALDAKSWLMSGSITLALFVGFAVGWLMEGTGLAWMQPFVDPAVLALVCLVVLPLPFADLRAAVADILRMAPADLDAHVIAVAEAAKTRHGFTDAYTYVARIGRSTLIEIDFLTPPGWPVGSIAELDAIRHEVSVALGDEGPDRWLTVSFTESPRWAF